MALDASYFIPEHNFSFPFFNVIYLTIYNINSNLNEQQTLNMYCILKYTIIN